MRKIRNPAAEISLPGFEVFHEEFISTRKEELVLLRQALIRADFQVLGKMAHKWKGFAAPYGFQELAELSVKLEASAANENSLLSLELLNEISDYLG